MNPDTPMRFVLAAALIADAIAGHLLYRNAFATPNGHQPVLAATALGLLVAGVAVLVVRKPTKLALSWARGIAIVMIVGLAGVGLLFFVAANFESGMSGKEQSGPPRGPWTGVGSSTRWVRRSTGPSHSGRLGSCSS